MKMKQVMAGFAAGAVCGAAAVCLANGGSFKKLRREATRTMRRLSTVATDISDLMK